MIYYPNFVIVKCISLITQIQIQYNHKPIMDSTKNWSDHLQMGQIQLKSRVCLAALTRQRCDPKDGVPTDMVVQYYAQRAGAGLMLTEASAWSPKGHAFPGSANIHTKEQMEGWKKVIKAVHEKGSKIFLQIFHSGRATHPKINGGLDVLAPSPIAVREAIRVLDGEPYPVPKEMTEQDIKSTQEEFRQGIVLAKEAGFDGVQIHGAHGYLVDEFLRSETNKRTDQYGGSVENRVRFCLELFDIALEYFKPWQLGIKISPVSRLRDMFDKNPEQTFSYLLKQLSHRKIGFVEIRESTEFNPMKSYYEITPPQQIENVCKTLRPYFTGILIANDSFNAEKGIKAIRQGWADMVSFGRLYISNPDLAERLIKGLQINQKWEFPTFYGYQHGPKGYTDYPYYNEWMESQKEKEKKEEKKQ